MSDSIPKTNPAEANDSQGGNLSPSPCSEFSVGDAVTVKHVAWDAPSDELPGGTYARPGERLIIRRIGGGTFPISVSHDYRTDGNTFGVNPEEIEYIPNKQICETAPDA